LNWHQIDRAAASLLLSTMQPGQLLCDRYRVEKALAAGGFGQTFLAVDTHLPSQPQVVVKLLKPAQNDPATLQIAQRLFNTEAETLERLGKDNDRIPSLYAYFPLQGEFYLVQEYIAGTTLTDELQKRKISESDTLAILHEILTGLTKVHSQNIIHRDLKPDNIIRRKIDRKLVLIDFGAVKQIRAASANAPNTIISQTIGIGTPGYMPTEQGMGSPKLASDVYAVGAIAVQCLTGSHPYSLFDKDTLQLEWQHLCRVNKDVATVIDRMIAPNYPQRYANATEALQAIESLISPPQVKSPPQTAATPVNPTLAINTPKLTRIQFTSVRLDNNGNIVDRPTGSAEIFTEDLGNDVELTMVKIPSGKFMMGSPESEKGRTYDESPQHQVISEFYFGQTQLTQAQWVAIMGNNRNWWRAILGNNPSHFKRNDQLPVEQVSWLAAIDFCQKLSQKTGRTYRLPNEAEWEYACRAGTTTPFAFGKTITPEVVNYNGDCLYGEAAKGEDRRSTTPVGSFPPNLFGLYDMHGNVWEWCLDEVIRPMNYPYKVRIMRGGSWRNYYSDCRGARKECNSELVRVNYTGFRVVCQPSRTC
jgi:eukaryotic-like serine/threonine-protein kinase